MSASYPLYQAHSNVVAALNSPPPALLQIGHHPTGMLPSIHHVTSHGMLNSMLESVDRNISFENGLDLKHEPTIFEPSPPKAIPVSVAIDNIKQEPEVSSENGDSPYNDIVQLQAATVVSSSWFIIW